MNSLNNYKKFLNINFKNKLLIKKALTHKSADQNHNNEKLEFLGDRVLGLVLSRKLFDLYPNESEGDLDKRFANLVKRKTCSEIGWNLGLQNFIIIGNQKVKITKKDEKILCDSCEAVIGAVYLDQGFDFVSKFVLKAWNKKIKKTSVTILDPKTKLQEYSLKKFKKLPLYKVMGATGPKHSPVYKISVSISGTNQFIGLGKSKQEAEQNSAKKLIKAENIN